MKIAIIGYGRMGREIEQLALKNEHQVILKIDSENDWKIKGEELKYADVAIEFSTPDTVVKNIKRCFDVDVPVVVGTTAWEEKLEDIKKICLSSNKALFVASNFSVGVNIYFEVNRCLAGLMDQFPGYDVEIEEIHHKQKLDAPSGTAKLLAEDIINFLERKKKWVNNNTPAIAELKITSLRRNTVPGTHKVVYTSENDEIEIIHTAKNRKGFAIGALMAAEWIIGKHGFFTMKDMLF